MRDTGRRQRRPVALQKLLDSGIDVTAAQTALNDICTRTAPTAGSTGLPCPEETSRAATRLPATSRTESLQRNSSLPRESGSSKPPRDPRPRADRGARVAGRTLAAASLAHDRDGWSAPGVDREGCLLRRLRGARKHRQARECDQGGYQRRAPRRRRPDRDRRRRRRLRRQRGRVGLAGPRGSSRGARRAVGGRQPERRRHDPHG